MNGQSDDDFDKELWGDNYELYKSYERLLDEIWRDYEDRVKEVEDPAERARLLELARSAADETIMERNGIIQTLEDETRRP